MALISFCSRIVVLFGLIGTLYLHYVRFSGYLGQLGNEGPAHSKHNGLLGLVGSEKHPIEVLVEQAKANHAHMVSRQSKTLEEAVTEYKRRYSREPRQDSTTGIKLPLMPMPQSLMNTILSWKHSSPFGVHPAEKSGPGYRKRLIHQ